MRSPLVATAILAIPLAGCTATSNPGEYKFWSGQLEESPQTPDCLTSLPPFGISLSQGLYSPNGTMATRSNGSWCALDVAFAYGTPSRVDVVQQPQHGALRVENVPGGLSLRYRAAADYGGGDGFSVVTEVGGRYWTIPVAVTVTR